MPAGLFIFGAASPRGCVCQSAMASLCGSAESCLIDDVAGNLTFAERAKLANARKLLDVMSCDLRRSLAAICPISVRNSAIRQLYARCSLHKVDCCVRPSKPPLTRYVNLLQIAHLAALRIMIGAQINMTNDIRMRTGEMRSQR
jgi:hypothetical protein